MEQSQIAQIVGAVIGAVTAVTIAGIIRLLNNSNDADY